MLERNFCRIRAVRGVFVEQSATGSLGRKVGRQNVLRAPLFSQSVLCEHKSHDAVVRQRQAVTRAQRIG